VVGRTARGCIVVHSCSSCLRHGRACMLKFGGVCFGRKILPVPHIVLLEFPTCQKVTFGIQNVFYCWPVQIRLKMIFGTKKRNRELTAVTLDGLGQNCSTSFFYNIIEIMSSWVLQLLLYGRLQDELGKVRLIFFRCCKNAKYPEQHDEWGSSYRVISEKSLSRQLNWLTTKLRTETNYAKVKKEHTKHPLSLSLTNQQAYLGLPTYL